MLDNILVNLKIISKIKEGNKICTNNKPGIITVDENTYVSKVMRKIMIEDRETNYVFIVNVVKCALEACIGLTKTNSGTEPNYKNFETLKIILVCLIGAVGGIRNLAKTYAQDISFTSKLELIIEKDIKLQIEEIKIKVPKLKDDLKDDFLKFTQL